MLIFVFSFNNPAGRYNFTWVGFTLKHWAHPFHDTELTKALLESIKLALLATVISTIIGTMMAIALVRHNFLGRRVANFLIVVPMATPEVVMGASLLSFFLILGTSLGFTTLLIAHVMFCISFVVVVVRSRLIGFDRSLEEAAKDLGADSFTTFRLVTFPLILPGIFGAAMLAFALSIDDFVISNFNAGSTVTFPLYIFGAAQRGIPVEVYVVAMILFFCTVAAMGFATFQQRRAEKMTAMRPEQEEARHRFAGDRVAGRAREGRTPLTTAGRFVRVSPPRCEPLRRLPADVEAEQLRDLGDCGGDRVRAAAFLLGVTPCAAMPRRIASPPIQWKGSGGTRGIGPSTKGRRVGSSLRSRAREARLRPIMLVGPTPLPV